MTREGRETGRADSPASTPATFDRRDALGAAIAEEAELATEAPIEIRCNAEPIIVTLASPSDLEDLAIGFLASEQIICIDRDIDVRIEYREPGYVVDVRAPRAKSNKQRAALSTSSCGLCGVQTLAEALASLPPMTPRALPAATAITQAVSGLREKQDLNNTTHAVHGAAWCDQSGRIIDVREDIGRHNALDKLLGSRRYRTTSGFVLVTSRIGYELVQKCVIHNVGSLVAISAPSALAVRLANSVNLNLIAVARPDNHRIYTRSEHHGG